MIHTLLRRPSGLAEATADALRALALVGIVVAGVGWGPLSGISLALVAGGMLLPRLLRLRPSVDIAFGVVVLVAVWSSVLGIYLTTRWWDLPVHFLTNGLCAALLYIVLVQFRVLADADTLPRPMLSAAVVTTTLGLALGVLWEVFEWFGHTYLDPEIFVGYNDSIGDLVWGGAGALLAGCGMSYLTDSPTSLAEPTADADPAPL
ncbi:MULTISPECIES: hypothetical protein [unclassified Cryobacterium]|uniref:hypothetical protein n=1 Tax=unclassified Cryobacterium TaxID=2649013 RepID=UPI00106D3961|nr:MULTISPECIES: hypothetical protein [unclassified Cryobacterium]TFC54690.1 hypothetical protein E3O68_08700 [Cryobacterium sp. TMB3-1-2]TFC71536.1 hypothetical protein E3T21_07985 [Cryobacterium sp. TMB3-15]TFC72347.1 hypothetical protein E3T22_18550 [Cryobacterium sp. TMB3-10]TFD42523.1 hypothetical protein E3T58_09045 [Cryobacterium sp. TMB3-12]